MKRKAWKTAIVAVLLVTVCVLLLYPAWIKLQRNNASVYMLIVTNHLKRHVEEKGEWPRSRQDLFPDGMPTQVDLSRFIDVNWHVTVEDILQSVEQVDDELRDIFAPPDTELLVLVAYTDRVPRYRNRAESERLWSWMTAMDIHKRLARRKAE
jgi:hypothetical protein